MMIKSAAALLAASLGIGLAAHAGAAQAFDVPMLTGFALEKGTGPNWLIAAAQLISWVGDTTQRVPMVLLCGAWLIYCQRPRAAMVVMITPLLASLASSLLKNQFGRARPDLVPHLDHVTNLSYPSGHASNAAAFLLLIALVIPRNHRPGWLGLAIVMTVLIGLSRLILGVHWPTDVIGGWAMGVAFALAGAAIVQQLERDRQPLKGQPT